MTSYDSDYDNLCTDIEDYLIDQSEYGEMHNVAN